jgi:hypothetical protein
LRTLHIGRDYGTSLEILSGLDVGEQIIINPSDSLENGQVVNIAQPSPGQKQEEVAPPAQKQAGSKS